MLQTCFVEAEAAGVDLYSDSPGRDRVSLRAFDEGPLDNVLPETEVPLPPGAVPNRDSGDDTPATPPVKRRKFFLRAEDDDGWARVR